MRKIIIKKCIKFDQCYTLYPGIPPATLKHIGLYYVKNQGIIYHKTFGKKLKICCFVNQYK